MTPEQLVARARSAMGRGVTYKLGAGGMRPAKSTPADSANRCDCSGFVCWALGISRKTDHPLYQGFNGGWINTDAMVNDASEPTGVFRPAPLVVPGVILVFPSGKRHRVGHCGIVSQTSPSAGVTKIIHCSARNSRNGDAIQETAPNDFQNPDTIPIWFEGLSQAPDVKHTRFG